MGHALRKHVFGHMRAAKVKIGRGGGGVGGGGEGGMVKREATL